MNQSLLRIIHSFNFLLVLFFSILAHGADGSFVDGLAVIELNQQYGYIDKTGKWAIEPIFDGAANFSEGLALVKTQEKYGFIDKSGNWVIEPRFEMGLNFAGGFALVKVYKPHARCDSTGFTDNFHAVALIDKTGEEVITLGCYDDLRYLFDIGGFHDGLAEMFSHKKAGVINTSGQFVIQPSLYAVGIFSEGLAAAKDSEGIGYVDKEGNWVVKPTFHSAGVFADGLANVMIENDKYGFIDKSGNWVIEPKFNYIYGSEFSEGLVRVQTQGHRSKIGYMDKLGKMVIAPTYFVANDFSEGRAAVQVDNRWGYIDASGKVVIKPRFQTAGNFSEGLAAVHDDKGFGYIDKSGKWAISPAALERNLHQCKNVKCIGNPNPNSKGSFVGV